MDEYLSPSAQAARPAMAVNLVLFTVAEPEQIQRLAGLGLVSGVSDFGGFESGLSLFVLTVRPPEKFLMKLSLDESSGERVLPFGYVEGDEKLTDTARRIASQKLGLDARIRFRDGGIFDEPHRTPGRRVVAFSYWGFVPFEAMARSLGGPDRIGLELVNSEQELAKYGSKLEYFDGVCRFGARQRPDAKSGHTRISSSELGGRRILGFDGDEMVFYAWRKLRHAISGPLDPFRYLGVPFLGETFRFSDLKAFNDVVRGEITQRDAFKRTVMNRDFVTESNIIDKSRRGKPTNLWTVSAPIREYLESAPDETQEEL